MELTEILKRIESRLEKTGQTAAAVSRAAGKPDAIRNLQRAVEKDHGRQGVSTATLNALAPHLGTTAIWLLAEAGPEERDGPSVVELPSKHRDAGWVKAAYGGVVEAGAYRPVAEFEDDPDREGLTYPRDPQFPQAGLFVFDVAGDSMNALQPRPILPGDRLLCVGIEQVRTPLRDRMVVIVEQVINGGLLRERSVKQVEEFEDRFAFCPRSRSARHAPIVVPKDFKVDDGRTVAVIAIVRSIVNQVPLG